MRNCKYEELSASQFAQALKEKSLVYVPVGSLEFHGRHLPMGMDTIHAYEFCLQVAQQTGGVVLPPTYWGTAGRDGWTGSLLVSEATFRALMTDIFRLLAQQDVKLIVAMTGHYPEVQGGKIARIAEEYMQENPSSKILVLDPFGTNPRDQKPDHGGKKETSLMLALRPELVHMEELADENAFQGITRTCVDGTEKYGREYFEASVANCVFIVQAALKKQNAHAEGVKSKGLSQPAVGLGLSASPGQAHALVNTPEKRKAYFERMIKALVIDLGPHPTGSTEAEVAQKIYLAEMQRAIPAAHFDRHWTEWQELHPGAQLVLDGHQSIDVKACQGSLPTPIKGYRGVLRKIDLPGIPYALVNEKTGEVSVQIEISPYVGPVAGYMVDRYTLETTRFCLGQENIPAIEEAVARKTPAWAHLRAMYYPLNASNNIVANIPGELSNQEILFIVHMDVFPITAGLKDDTGSTIVLLMLARQLAGRTLKRPVTFLCSGSQELNTDGVQHYLKKRQMDGSIGNIRYLFKLDSLSFGPDFFIDSRDQGLRDLLQQIHTDLNIRTKMVFRDRHGFQHDGEFFRKAMDARCVWICGQDPNGQPPQPTTMDTLELFENEGVESTFLILLEMIERLQAPEL